MSGYMFMVLKLKKLKWFYSWLCVVFVCLSLKMNVYKSCKYFEEDIVDEYFIRSNFMVSVVSLIEGKLFWVYFIKGMYMRLCLKKICLLLL